MRLIHTFFIPILLIPHFAFAVTSPDVAKVGSVLERPEAGTSAFRMVADVVVIPPLVVPTVIEIPFGDGAFAENGVVVVDTKGEVQQPTHMSVTSVQVPTPFTVTTEPPTNGALLTDGDALSSVDFLLPTSGQGRATLIAQSARPITASYLQFTLAPNVTAPTSVEISALTPGGERRIVVASREIYNSTVRFPQTTAREWTITLTYVQPLRLTALAIPDERAEQRMDRRVRFLAQPQHTYRLYADTDNTAIVGSGVAYNLANTSAVQTLSMPPLTPNPAYVEMDSDTDGIPDTRDNCPSIANISQEDINTNDTGDVCDDFDVDYVMNTTDNCPDIPNRDQKDTDGDGLGDACDTEESRFTEQHPWVPWLGIGCAALVLISLMSVMVVAKPKEESA